ncbi:helix-turn-helix domain-containing protein [Eisenbergiella sp.]
MNRKQTTFMEYFYYTIEIAGSIFDKAGRCLFQTGMGQRSNTYLWKILSYKLRENNNKIPYLYEIGENIYAWGMTTTSTKNEEEFILFGPIASPFMNSSQKKEFTHHNHLGYEITRIPQFGSEKFLHLLAFSYYGICDVNISVEELLNSQSISLIPQPKEKTDYDLYRIKEDKDRISYEKERLLSKYIEEGKVKTQISDIDEYINYGIDQIGIMSSESEFKQLEYMLVTSITLATRAAIKGGVPPSVAYETSDVLLQKISKCKEIMPLHELGRNYAKIFSDLVNQYKRQSEQSQFVENCKRYVAEHLFAKFTIQEMAKALSMNRTYLSSKFAKKTGMTIRDYILQERLIAASNMLRYSGESVSLISDYMQFSSPGRFSAYFRKKYGITPLKYREEKKWG